MVSQGFLNSPPRPFCEHLLDFLVARFARARFAMLATSIPTIGASADPVTVAGSVTRPRSDIGARRRTTSCWPISSAARGTCDCRASRRGTRHGQRRREGPDFLFITAIVGFRKDLPASRDAQESTRPPPRRPSVLPRPEPPLMGHTARSRSTCLRLVAAANPKVAPIETDTSRTKRLAHHHAAD
jgi:hypothetical protein